MPGMTPENNVPWFAPGRPMIVSDPAKLTYFARANAIRAGVQNMPAALSGVAVGDSDWSQYPDAAPGDMRAMTSLALFDPTVDIGPRTVPNSISAASYSMDSSGVETPTGAGTLDTFFNALNNLIRSPSPNTYGAPPSVAPSPWPWVIGAGAVGMGLLLLSKKRRR